MWEQNFLAHFWRSKIHPNPNETGRSGVRAPSLPAVGVFCMSEECQAFLFLGMNTVGFTEGCVGDGHNARWSAKPLRILKFLSFLLPPHPLLRHPLAVPPTPPTQILPSQELGSFTSAEQFHSLLISPVSILTPCPRASELIFLKYFKLGEGWQGGECR